MPTKVMLDVDTGIDDTIALLYAALHPAVDLLGATSTWGNVPLTIATRNTQHALHLAGHPEIPVGIGSPGPIDGRPAVFAYQFHGDDGQGNAGDPSYAPPSPTSRAAEQIIGLAREHPGEIKLVAVGPLTNLAIALALDPALPDVLRGVTIMGGAALAPGNVTPTAEANIWCDPVAAQAVFAASWDLTMVPLDVTMRTLLDESHRLRLAQGGKIGRYVSEILDFYFGSSAKESFGRRQSCMHDVLAVAVAAGTLVPDLAPVVRAEVDTSDGPGRGQTICDLRGRYAGFPPQDDARCRVVLESDPGFADVVVDFLRDA